MKKINVAIDGPAGAGKSTVARIVAKELGFTYIDTGAMYRAVAWKALRSGAPPFAEEELRAIVENISIQLATDAGRLKVSADGADITDAIRTPAVTALVSDVAKIGAVREKMLLWQRELAQGGGVVMDGRDIASRVLPDAEVKIFLTASIEERARRRWLELKEKGYAASPERLRAEIAARDQADSERKIAPLVQTADAVRLDCTRLDVAATAAEILKICRERTCHGLI